MPFTIHFGNYFLRYFLRFAYLFTEYHHHLIQNFVQYCIMKHLFYSALHIYYRWKELLLEASDLHLHFHDISKLTKSCMELPRFPTVGNFIQLFFILAFLCLVLFQNILFSVSFFQSAFFTQLSTNILNPVSFTYCF